MHICGNSVKIPRYSKTEIEVGRKRKKEKKKRIGEMNSYLVCESTYATPKLVTSTAHAD